MHQTVPIRVHTAVLIIVLLLAVAGTAFVLLCLPQPPREVTIGAVFPLSGQDAAAGRDIQVALELAAEIVNNEYDLDLPLARTTGLPALDGAAVRIHFADTKGNPETGSAEAERLITGEQVVALTGAWHSAVTGSASTAAEEHGIPFICGSSTEPALTERGYAWFFRTTPNDLAFSDALLRFAQEVNKTYDMGMRTVVIVSIDNEWGRSAVAAEQRFIEETGFELLEIIAYDPTTTTNVSELALQVAMHDPDILIQNSYTADAIRFMQAYKRLNCFPALFLAQDAGFETTEFLQTMGSDADFIVTRSAWAGLDNPNPLVSTVNELYRARHPEGADMDGQTAREFTAFLVLADAINRAGSTDPEKIRTALAETNWPAKYLVTGWDGVAFDEHGQNSKATPALLQRQEGQWRAVWPDEIAPHRALVPAPNWDERGVSTSVQQPAPSETTILVINSYGPEMAWEQDIQRGIIEGLARSGYGEGHHTYALQTYCMDTKVNYTTPEQIEARAEAACNLIAEHQPDLVFVNDDNALKYVAVEYTKRYPERELPFVFSGVNLDPTIYEPIASLDRPGGPITGALERVPYDEAFTLAQRIFPNVSTIVILADASPSTDLVVSTFRERYPASAAESPLTVIGLLQVTSFADWKRQITDYQTEADVIGVLNYYQLRDETGAVVPAKEVANWTIHHNNLPEIGFVATDPGDGFLAAVSASYYKTGIYVGLIGGEILSGVDPAEIPIVDPHVVDITFNLERAEMLGITIPRAELAEATAVYHTTG